MRVAIALVALAVTVPCASEASEGRTEINQAAIDANGGFPFTIAAAGSYVLTSDLSPPASTPAIRVAAQGVAIDMNGFRIHSSAVCVPGQCQPTGGGGAIVAGASPSAGVRAVVRNGQISGIDGPAIDLRGESIVENVSISEVTGDGIRLGDNGAVRSTRVSGVGGAGLLLGAGTAFSQNVLAHTGLASPGAPTAQGGVSGGLNVCDDGRCGGSTRLMGFTSTLMNGGQGIFTMVAACNAEFRGTRVCSTRDIVLSSSVPPGLSGEAWVRPEYEPNNSSGEVEPWSGLQLGNGYSYATCKGWTYTDPGFGGGMAVSAHGGFRADYSQGSPPMTCAELRAVACCAGP